MCRFCWRWGWEYRFFWIWTGGTCVSDRWLSERECWRESFCVAMCDEAEYPACQSLSICLPSSSCGLSRNPGKVYFYASELYFYRIDGGSVRLSMLFRPYSSSRWCNKLRFLRPLLVDDGMSSKGVRNRKLPRLWRIEKQAVKGCWLLHWVCVMAEMIWFTQSDDSLDRAVLSL